MLCFWTIMWHVHFFYLILSRNEKKTQKNVINCLTDGIGTSDVKRGHFEFNGKALKLQFGKNTGMSHDRTKHRALVMECYGTFPCNVIPCNVMEETTTTWWSSDTLIKTELSVPNHSSLQLSNSDMNQNERAPLHSLIQGNPPRQTALPGDRQLAYRTLHSK
jgi:hypothetical protein